MPTKAQLENLVDEYKEQIEKIRIKLDDTNQELEHREVVIKGLNRAIGELQFDEDEHEKKLDTLEEEKEEEIKELEGTIEELEGTIEELKNKTYVKSDDSFVDDEIMKKCSAIVIGFNKGQGNKMEFSNFLDLCIDRYKCLYPIK